MHSHEIWKMGRRRVLSLCGLFSLNQQGHGDAGVQPPAPGVSSSRRSLLGCSAEGAPTQQCPCSFVLLSPPGCGSSCSAMSRGHGRSGAWGCSSSPPSALKSPSASCETVFCRKDFELFLLSAWSLIHHTPLPSTPVLLTAWPVWLPCPSISSWL